MPYLLVVVRFLLPLTLPLWVKGVAAVLLLVGSQYHLWCRLSSGSVFSPEFPRPLVILFNWAFGTILFLAMFLLVLDAVTLPMMLVLRSELEVPDAVRYAIAALASLLAAFGVQAAVRVPPLTDVTIDIRGLPPQFDGYRVLQLTDLHISRLFPAAWTRKVVERSNALGVDLIVVTGDFIDGTLAARRADVEPLRDLSAPDGVYAIPGNHEYFFGYREWMSQLAGMGLRLLANEHVVLARGHGRVILAGVTDLSAVGTAALVQPVPLCARSASVRRSAGAPAGSSHATPPPEARPPRGRHLAGGGAGKPGPDLSAALAGAPAGVPIVLLDHQPRMAKQAAARGVSLQLSGHTHGGMIRGLDRLVARGNGGFVSGRYDVEGMTLYVNNGTGLWPGFALRLGRPPELTRLTLRRLA